MQLGQCSIAAVDLESNAEGWVLTHLLSYIITLVVSICGTFLKKHVRCVIFEARYRYVNQADLESPALRHSAISVP